MKKLFHHFFNKLPKFRFATKLFISYLALIIVPLLLVVTINFYRSASLAEEQAVYSNEKVLAQTTSFISYKVDSIKNIIDMISYDETIQNVMTTSEAYYRQEINNWFIQTTTIKSIIFNSYSTDDITTVRLYMKDGPAAIEETDEFKKMSSAEQTTWFNRLESKKGANYQWFPYSFFKDQYKTNHISLIKEIPSSKILNKFIGIIKADVPEKVMQDILNQTTTTKNATAILFNSRDELITYSGNQDLSSPELLDSILKENAVLNKGTLKKISRNGKTYLIGTREIENTDWRIVLLVPSSDILSATVVYRNQMFEIVLILILVSIPVIYLTSKSLTTRLRKLQHHMKIVDTDNFNVNILENGNDEIGELTKSFNYMLLKISALMEEQYQLGYEIKNLELKVLQSQINPHFLYNSLDMIHWLAVKNKVSPIADAVNALARFYKLSLGHGEDIVTIEKEVEHVSAYVSVQNMRFGDSIMLNVDLTEEIKSYKMIKIILQPLVENAILHGILEKESESGTITIEGKLEEETITLIISDDGVGMTPEQVDSLFHQELQKSGYGIWNINERIKLNYGSKYGLRYESELGVGTSVFVSFTTSMHTPRGRG